ncbi:MAG: VPLPA-CTERM sorting domain-containing protein [Cycloclasticus sp.]|uniref:VPLPA-CTERM sorting domain-containing protein n=1 Tax=Cycloclasticus sp. TaxID=2024830 RepID=UPI00257A5463|nr:VPLPA-CTERM sorting domain-containing protein [Cycloclasticus sp.]MBV1898543.1 VPLPA-CTERM sorting domain-containing protein [Cycloclasticus sp.]
MKKITILSIILGCVASFSANSALITSSTNSALDGATVETFNSIGLGDYSSLSVSGATIVGNGGDMTISNDFNTTSFGVDGYALQNAGGTPTSFSIIFDNAVDAFGIWGGAYNNSWTFSAFDSLDNLIESVTASTSCCSPMFFGLLNNDMAKVTLSGAGDWVIFDNLTYKESVSAVPIPAAALMFLPALLGFLGLRRKLQA